MDDEVFSIEPMRLQDLEQVRRIERASFPALWPRNAYRREILNNARARYLVVRMLDGLGKPAPRRTLRFPFSLLPLGSKGASDIVAYAGIWIMMEEAHITTIATDPDYRRRGLGELLIVEMAKLAITEEVEQLTLEVRMSNEAAQMLYRKYGFSDGGIRPRYYSDDFEDALIMRSENLDSANFKTRVVSGEAALSRRLRWVSCL